MDQFQVKSSKDLYHVKQSDNSYSEIILDAKLLHQNNLLRYGLKYALWNLPVNGKLTINTNPHLSFGFKKDYIDFWQTSLEIGNSLKNQVSITEFNKKKGIISLVKNQELYKNNGVTLGVVFSGIKEEVEVITIALKSLLSQEGMDEIPHEIVLCGPKGYDLSTFQEKGVDITKVKFLACDFPTSPRIIITIKKNAIINQAKYNIVSISHGRISFPSYYLKELFKRKFDLITPKVIAKKGDKEFPFLDIGLIGSYDIYKTAVKRSISGPFIKKDYLSQFKYRVPYIEGSVTVFNKETCPILYNENVAWGEAEDVEISARAYYDGALLDYFDDLICQTNTMKYDPELNFKAQLKHNILSWLIDRGLN